MKRWVVFDGRARQLARPVVLSFVVLVVAMFAVVLVDPRMVKLAASAPTTADTALPPGEFKPTSEQWKAFEIGPVQLATFHSESTTEGSIAIDDDLTTPIYSPYSGHVVKLIAKLGDHVERGAPLFAVEATEYVNAANTLITAVGAAKTAQSQLKQAEINEKRAHDLYLANGGALKDWQQSKTDLAAAQNAARSADIALAAARNQLRILGQGDNQIAALEAAPTQQLDPVAIVRSPIEGTVTQRQVGIGQNIQSISAGASTPVYTIGDLSTVWLIANVREEDVPLMHIGAPVAVRVPAYPKRVFNAKISWVAPALDPNTHRLQVRADVENPDGALKPMMFANFSITTGQDAAEPSVPQSAIVYEGEQARVWVAGANDTLALRLIKVGRTQDGKVEILSGLSAGEKVVIRGTVFIDRAGGTS